VFYDLAEGDVFSRLAMFLQVYVVGCIWMTELVPAFQHDSLIYLHEIQINATDVVSAGLVMGAPVVLGLILPVLSFGAPIYFLSDLRRNLYHIFMFFVALYMSMLSNLFLAQLTAVSTNSPVSAMIIYPVGLLNAYLLSPLIYTCNCRV
jgi:hypothetical protein